MSICPYVCATYDCILNYNLSDCVPTESPFSSGMVSNIEINMTLEKIRKEQEMKANEYRLRANVAVVRGASLQSVPGEEIDKGFVDSEEFSLDTKIDPYHYVSVGQSNSHARYEVLGIASQDM